MLPCSPPPPPHSLAAGRGEGRVVAAANQGQQAAAHAPIPPGAGLCRRGLELVLSQRKSLLQYLYKKDRNAYDR
jgi:hypothetical protein